MDNLTDEKLVELYLRGRKRALEVLIKRYLTLIFNYTLKYVKDRAEADDLTQEVFVKVWKKIKKYDSRYKFKNWLYVIAKNTCLDYLKKNKAINFSELSDQNDELFFENLIKETAPSPELEITVKEDKALIADAINALPKKYQETIKLRYFSGYKFREIAGLLRVSIETIKSRNRRALNYLKKIIRRKTY